MSKDHALGRPRVGGARCQDSLSQGGDSPYRPLGGDEKDAPPGHGWSRLALLFRADLLPAASWRSSAKNVGGMAKRASSSAAPPRSQNAALNSEIYSRTVGQSVSPAH